LSSAKKGTPQQQQKQQQAGVPSPIITRGGEQAGTPTDPAQDVDFYNGPWLTMLEQLQLPPFTPPEGNALRFRFCVEHVLKDGCVHHYLFIYFILFKYINKNIFLDF
jgi:hypothetical protein